MAKVEAWFAQDLKKPVPVRYLDGSFFSEDAAGSRIGVEVYSDGEVVALAGSITGYCVRSDGTTVPISGTRSANRAYIDVPQSALAVPGPLTVTIKNTESSVITTLCAVVGIVTQSRTGVQVDPGQTITDWTNQISAQLQACQDAADNVGAALAVPYDSLTFPVVPGTYTTYSGNVYRANQDIDTSEEWTPGHWTQVKVCDEINDLKSVVNYLHGNIAGTATIISNLYINPNSDKFSSTTGDLSVLVIPVSPSSYYKVWKKTPTTMRLAVGNIQTPVNNDVVTKRVMHSSASSEPLTIDTSTTDTYLYIQLYISADAEQYRSNDANTGSLVVYKIDTSVDELEDRVDDAENDITVIQARSALYITEYDATVAYDTGDYVIYNGMIYKRKARTAAPSAEAWTSGHWTAVATLADETTDRLPLSYFAGYFSASAAYSKGDYMLYNGGIYRAKFDISAGSLTMGNWELVGENIFDVISGAESDTASAQKVCVASYNVPVERYENIEYIDLVTNQTEVTGNNANTVAELDKSIRFQHLPFSIKATIASGNANGTLVVTVPSFAMLGTQEFEVYLYVEDASDVGLDTEVSGQTVHRVLRLQGNVTGMSKYYATDLRDGWNKIRFITSGSSTDFSKSETQWKLTVYKSDSSADLSFWVGAVYAVKPDKANLIIIDDGPYQSFYEDAYPSLKTAGIPVTWAIDPMRLSDQTGGNENLISQTTLELLAYDGVSEFSFHNYDGTTMTGATAEAALRDTLNCIRYLKQHGLEPERIFRAAWFHNDCTHPELANEVVDASASHDGSSGFTQFPFQNRYNIPRYPMQGRNEATVDSIFTALQNQHTTILMYTHGVGGPEPDEPGGDTNTNVSVGLLSYYVSKIQAGIQAGWLNATTYNRMMNHYRRIK